MFKHQFIVRIRLKVYQMRWGTVETVGLRHRKSSLVIKTPPNEKALAPPGGSKDRKHFSAVPPCLPPARPLMTMPTHRLPHNAGNASKILRPKPVPSALCGPFAAPLHAPLSAPGTLCGGDKQLYFRFVGLKYDMPIKHQVCAFVKNFFARRKDKIQPPATAKSPSPN